jgi:ketosteroid isomerase-like protein
MTGMSASASAWADKRSVAPMLNSDDERAVWKTHTDLVNLFLRGDAAGYAKLTADNFVRLNDDGTSVGKSQFLETVKKNAGQSPGHLETGDVQIIVDGNTARVVLTMWGMLPGGRESAPSRMTKVYEKRNGRWQQVAAAFTLIAEQE